MKTTSQRGYAILFAVILVSVISVIAFGLSNSTYKQVILSSVASDSEQAFFQSDSATECALYADKVERFLDGSDKDFYYSCGHELKGTASMVLHAQKTDDITQFIFTPHEGTPDPCFEFDITRDTNVQALTTIKARGYNSCNKSSLRTVEREIKVTY